MDSINGEIVSATDIRKHWKDISDSAINDKKTIYVLSNNVPSVVIIDYKEYQKIQKFFNKM